MVAIAQNLVPGAALAGHHDEALSTAKVNHIDVGLVGDLRLHRMGESGGDLGRSATGSPTWHNMAHGKVRSDGERLSFAHVVGKDAGRRKDGEEQKEECLLHDFLNLKVNMFVFTM